MLQNDVFERRGENTIPDGLFYSLFFLLTSTGPIGAAATAHIVVSNSYKPSLFDGFLFCFAMPVLGVFITSLHKGLWTSFIGYNIAVIPLGFVLGPLMKGIGEYVFRDICIQTIITMCVVWCIGIRLPATFNNKGNLILATISGILVTLTIHFSCSSLWEQTTWIQIIILTSLSFYITYYLYRARMVSRTVHNSMDIASRLYLDVVVFFLNVFITNDPKQTQSR